MGDVAVRLKVLPSGADTDLNKIKAELQTMGAKDIRERPVAFGLRLLDVLFVVPDEEGSNLEEKIAKIPGVSSVETESVTLV